MYTIMSNCNVLPEPTLEYLSLKINAKGVLHTVF